MKAKNFLMIFAMMIGVSLSLQLSTVAAQENDPMDNTNGMQQNDPCSNLSQDAQDFAAQLTPVNRTIFCQQFTLDQQSQAMMDASSGVSDNQGNVLPGQRTLGPDAAVQKVLTDSETSMMSKHPNSRPAK